jgi:hypothetical protein
MPIITPMAINFIEGITRDFDTRLMEQHREAMQCQNVRSFIKVGLSIGGVVLGAEDLENCTPEDNASLQVSCRAALRGLTYVRQIANEFIGKGHEIDGLPELDEIVVDVRMMLGRLIDLQNGNSGPLPEITGSQENTAPDSWFKEDPSKLLGPFA